MPKLSGYESGIHPQVIILEEMQSNHIFLSPWTNQSPIKLNQLSPMILQLIIKTLEGNNKNNIFNDPEESFSDYLISLQRVFIGRIKLFNVLTYLNKSAEAGDVTVLPERCTEDQ